MAAENAPGFDDFAESESAESETEDEPTVKLDPGESIVARIRHVENEVGEFDNDLYHVTRLSDKKPVAIWSNYTLRTRAEEEDLGPGDLFAMRKSEESREYDGDEYYPVEVRTDLDGGDN